MTTAIDVHGTCDAAFRGVEDAFRENFERFPEAGAGLCVYVAGKPVVDVWGGHRDGARTLPWERDTVVNVWSTTKGLVATCAARLAGEGRLDLDSPVTTYWPEFAQAGKDSVTVRHLLSHRAGLPAFHAPMPIGSMSDWDVMTTALAAEEPWWTPGEKHGYHAFTYGFLVGEVIRRVTGKSVRDYVRDEIAGPLGIDFQIGIPERDDARCAENLFDTAPPAANDWLAVAMADPNAVTTKTLMNPADPFLPGHVNTPAWRRAQIRAANGHATAHAVARLYGSLSLGGELDGVRIVTPEALADSTREQASGPDAVLTLDMRWASGFGLNAPGVALGPNMRTFGHSGAGGSLGFADPDAHVGFGYVMNQMLNAPTLADPRWESLIDAVYAAL